MRNISLCVVCLYASKRLQDNWFKCINNFMIRVWKFEHIKTKQSVNTNIFHFMNRIVEWHANKDLHNFSYWLQFYFWRTKCLLQLWNNFVFFITEYWNYSRLCRSRIALFSRQRIGLAQILGRSFQLSLDWENSDRLALERTQVPLETKGYIMQEVAEVDAVTHYKSLTVI